MAELMSEWSDHFIFTYISEIGKTRIYFAKVDTPLLHPRWGFRHFASSYSL